MSFYLQLKRKGDFMILFSQLDGLILLVIVSVFFLILGFFEAYFYVNEVRIQRRGAYYSVSMISFLLLALTTPLYEGSMLVILGLGFGALIRMLLVRYVFKVMSKDEPKAKGRIFRFVALKVFGIFVVGEVLLNIVAYIIIASTTNTI